MPAQDGAPVSNSAPAQSSHMMKTTKRGRPFLKDTFDLFSTLITSLELGSHKQFFKTYHNSFTTDDAATHLATLKFAQSNRGPDPRDPVRIVTTTTTTTFSMTRDMAKAMAQHFMDARLIENAVDPASNLFKDRGVYQITPKGLHVLERFIFRNGMNAERLLPVFQTQPICMKLLHLERRQTDDEIIVSQSVVAALFRRFVGRQANTMPDKSQFTDPNAYYTERAKGMPLFEYGDRQQGTPNRSGAQPWVFCFSAVAALEWLCDFTSVVGRDEAAEMSAHFVRFGLVTLVNDKRKGGDSAIIFTVRGNPGQNVAAQGEFRCTSKAIYRITDEGRRVARWDVSGNARGIPLTSSSNGSSTNVDSSGRESSDRSEENHASVTERAFGPGAGNHEQPTIATTNDLKMQRRVSMAGNMNAEYQNGGRDAKQIQQSNAERLQYILNEPPLRSLFREFLKGNFCEENLSFWLDVQDFKKKFATTSSANSSAAGKLAKANVVGHLAMEQHHETLIAAAFAIYNTYLAQASPNELNIDHSLRNDLVVYLTGVMTGLTGKTFQGYIDPEHARSVNATQLQNMIQLYERIQAHVFRLMSTDSVPKFVKTSKFQQLKHWVDDLDLSEELSTFSAPTASAPSMPPGLDVDEIGRTYVTISQAANEKAHQGQSRSAQ